MLGKKKPYDVRRQSGKTIVTIDTENSEEALRIIHKLRINPELLYAFRVTELDVNGAKQEVRIGGYHLARPTIVVIKQMTVGTRCTSVYNLAAILKELLGGEQDERAIRRQLSSPQPGRGLNSRYTLSDLLP